VPILSAPGGEVVSGDVLGWLPRWFVHAPNGAIVAISTAAAKAASLFKPVFMGWAYPN
jgi:hypothetical protein